MWLLLLCLVVLLLTGYAFWVKMFFWFGSPSWEWWLFDAVENPVLQYIAWWGSVIIGGAITLILVFGALTLLYTLVFSPYFLLRAWLGRRHSSRL